MDQLSQKPSASGGNSAGDRCFQRNESVISSANFLKSNEVLETLRADLTKIGFSVEAGNGKQDKIRVPVLFGEQGSEALAFEADGYCPQRRMVLEIEAGRGVTNNQFLKDFFEARMMVNVEWFCVAVRQIYRGYRDYEKVRDFFDAMYLSGRIQTELSGVLVMGTEMRATRRQNFNLHIMTNNPRRMIPAGIICAIGQVCRAS